MLIVGVSLHCCRRPARCLLERADLRASSLDISRENHRRLPASPPARDSEASPSVLVANRNLALHPRSLSQRVQASISIGRHHRELNRQTTSTDPEIVVGDSSWHSAGLRRKP